MLYQYLAPALLLAASLHAADPSVITIPSKNLFPESITSTSGGALIIGSFGTSSIWRIPAGQNTASQWIDATANKGSLLGVFADEKDNRLLVCQAGVKVYDLKTGAPKEQLALPPGANGNPFCNDIAVRDNGAIYVTDTVAAKVFMFPKGSTTAVQVAADPILAGVDGLAFLGSDKLYVNTVTTHKLLRLDLAKDGTATKITELKLSRPVQSPDGMRAIDGKRMIIAAANCQTAIATPNGDSAEITYIKEDSNEAGCPGVTVTKGVAWTVEGKLRQRDAKNPEADKGPFRLFPVPLPK